MVSNNHHITRKPSLTASMFEKVAANKKNNIIARLKICGDRFEIKQLYAFDNFFDDDYATANKNRKPKFDFWITKYSRGKDDLVIRCDRLAKKFHFLFIDRSLNEKYSVEIMNLPRSDDFVVNADHIDVLRYESTAAHVKARSMDLVYVNSSETNVDSVICPNVNNVITNHVKSNVYRTKKRIQDNYEKTKPTEKPSALICAFFAIHHERATIKCIQQ